MRVGNTAIKTITNLKSNKNIVKKLENLQSKAFFEKFSQIKKMSGGPGPIPARWLKCPRKSDALIGGKFLGKFEKNLSLRFQK